MEWLKISKTFETLWNLPHTVGALNGKNVVLQAPIISGSDFCDKSTFSIVLMALVNGNSNFLFADVGCQGRISEGGVFKSCKLQGMLTNSKLPLQNIPRRSPTLVGSAQAVHNQFLWCSCLAWDTVHTSECVAHELFANSSAHQSVPTLTRDRENQKMCNMFGFGKDTTLIFHIPKMYTVVILISTLHHSNTIDEETGVVCKAEILTFYNATKGGNTVDELKANYSDARKSCKHNYEHLQVKHSMNSVDPVTGANTQKMERVWYDVRHGLPQYSRRTPHFVRYLSEFMFHRQGKIL
ncbi:hypothetical protein PR048_020141 [Dryococelus australis]|uniref:Uncharacterized protein n=1 Tax=Dryococelus australis TaxID=614101 RepID=A0ABQ9H5V1_9NEOP|nr:hypothetical protein PR048_020141 [Dryococelus australis]